MLFTCACLVSTPGVRAPPLPFSLFMLPAGKQLLQLEVLNLDAGLQQPAAAASSPSAAAAGSNVESTGSSSVGILDACDVFRIADACPALRALCLSHVLRDVVVLPGVVQDSAPNCCSLSLEAKVRLGAGLAAVLRCWAGLFTKGHVLWPVGRAGSWF